MRSSLPWLALLVVAASCASSAVATDAGRERPSIDRAPDAPEPPDDVADDATPFDAALDMIEEDAAEKDVAEDIDDDVPALVPVEDLAARTLYVLPEATVVRAPSRTGPVALAWGRIADLFPLPRAPYPTAQLDVGYGVADYAFGDRFGCEFERRDMRVARCWGRNELGQLGRGGLTRAEPISRTGWLLSGVRRVAAGAAIACALADRTYCWGFPRGTTEPELSMVHAVDSPALVALWGSPTADHLCGTDAEGAAFCYGVNRSGETGEAPTALRSTARFRRVLNLRGVVSMAMAEGVTMAVRRDGSLWCWGRCTLPGGHGFEGPAHLPRRVEGLPLVTQATTATQPSVFTCARTTEGGVYCWGRCESNNLGRACEPGEFDAPARPVPVIEDVAEVYTAGDHTCARANDGRLWCWGNNEMRAVHPGVLRNAVIEPTRFDPVMP